MIGLITSCQRPDLLEKTYDSFFRDQKYPLNLKIFIHEDSDKTLFNFLPGYQYCLLNGVGQHKSIEHFLEYVHDETNEVYYVHLEDDWEFKNSYDWIFESIKILRSDPDIIKVLCNSDSPHPCVYDHELLDNQSVTRFGYLNPWVNDGIKWYGFSWNPGVTRWDYLKKFVPFPRWEQDLSKVIHDAGYEVVRLEKGVCTHIGQGRSTHE